MSTAATIIQGAIRGMIDALDDPYSSYLSSDEYRQTLAGHQRRVRGHRRRDRDESRRTARRAARRSGPTAGSSSSRPIAGSPAETAGMLAGDLVLAADGVSLDGLTVDGARDRIRGPKGSRGHLSIQRGTDEPFALQITRDVIQQEEVVSKPRWPTAPSATSGSTASRIAAPTESRRPCGRTSRPGGRRSSSTCAATPAAT